MAGTLLRGVRAAIFTALVVTLSAASHVLLSRVPLPLTSVLPVAAGVFAVAYALAGRERGYRPIAGLLVPLELAADTVFTVGQHACYGPSGGPVAGSLRSVGVEVPCGDAVGAPLSGVAVPETAAAALLRSGDPTVPWLLLAAHVAVGLVAAAWLRHGEAALGRVLRAAGSSAFRPLLAAWAVSTARGAAPRPAPRAGTRRRTSAHTRLLVHSVARRGPPRRPVAA
ncbi:MULTISPECIES: hypothetical protein [Streptomyces]|uniref:Integral membrane protein n=1 Tax=Streptomyces sudanensis TaxID=436397 RepID=A0ABY4TG36_9ACTN|nr:MULTISPECIES: hypothetical protein [Streptomyces]MCP9959337.1 hypothetical protein [Streptomyces sudanensis]MCP9988413.1 hypothetical protein [Streptomyces sudanensis]MCQ0000204.1 hypothetical protein [Streptomyces sudanensis]URN15767.1 hypothetical protein MW084_07130 [Streptomyces sudanensis]